MNKIQKLPKSLAKSIFDKAFSKVSGDEISEAFDEELYAAGKNNKQPLMVINPAFDPWILDYIDPQGQHSNKLLVLAINEIWAIKIFPAFWTPDLGSEIVNCEIDLEIEEEINYNPDVPVILTPLREKMQELRLEDEQGLEYAYRYVWQTTQSDKKIWLADLSYIPEPIGIKGIHVECFPDVLDIIFISYDELDADKNYADLLKKAPWAKRVHGVKGILEAHKAAAKLATTDMFYVVDGDASILPSWNFDFKPNVFDANVVHVWDSINPINNLKYGYGGVKLFPRDLLLSMHRWNKDLTTEMHRLKLMHDVSNITAFNTSEFNTWRSAFRECAKLTINNTAESKSRLLKWTKIGKDKPYGEFAIAGAKAGNKYAIEIGYDLDKIKLINDYDWLEEQFTSHYTD